MAGKGELIRKLVECIEQFADEWPSRFREDEWRAIETINRDLQVRPGGKDKRGYLLVDRAPAVDRQVVDIWASRKGRKYIVCYPITDDCGTNIERYNNLDEAREDFDQRRIKPMFYPTDYNHLKTDTK
ncbi:MAG: hypothetical protein DDT30_02047 [Dehalococcoidia bacterium]|nr:hypothetical protein [Bacillota bacterium]